jgi:hypothetical protein
VCGAKKEIFFVKILGKGKIFFSSFTTSLRGHVGVSGRLSMHIYFNYGSIGR